MTDGDRVAYLRMLEEEHAVFVEVGDRGDVFRIPYELIPYTPDDLPNRIGHRFKLTPVKGSDA